MRKYILLFTAYCLNVGAQNWEPVVDMVPTDGEQSDFGLNMIFADDYLVVGWPRTFVHGASPDSCGEVITYQKHAGAYEELSRISAADLVGDCVAGDGFGYGLAFDNGRLAIGMPAGARAGSNLPGGGTDADSRVFITTFSNGTWELENTLIADDLGAGKGMGFQLVMEDDLLLVGAHEYDSIFGVSFPISTGVYVFQDNGSGFAQQQKLVEDHHLFGQDFDTEDGQIVVGAWGEQTIGASGKVFVFEEQSGDWILVQTINDSRNKNLGNQIEIHGDMMVAGSIAAGDAGAVVVFKRDQGMWQEQQFIEPSDGMFNDQFGFTVRLDEDELLVGATAGTNSMQTLGAVYHFTLDGNGQFVERQKIETPHQNEGEDQFGANLIFNDTDLLVNELSGRRQEGGTTNFWHFSRQAELPPHEVNVNSRTSGIWQVDGIEGQSFNIEVLDDDSAWMYLNHTGENGSTWYLGLGAVNGNSVTFEEVMATSGPSFGTDFTFSDINIEVVGRVDFEISSCTEGVLTLRLEGEPALEWNLSKTSGISSLDCQAANKVLENGVSGSWFNPDRAGEGFSVYTHDLNGGQKASVYWYTYDSNGQAVTISGQAEVVNNTISIDSLKLYGEGELFESTGDAVDVGTLDLIWDSCSEASYSYDLSMIGLGTGGYDLVQLTRVKDGTCQL